MALVFDANSSAVPGCSRHIAEHHSCNEDRHDWVLLGFCSAGIRLVVLLQSSFDESSLPARGA
jgi:hypothetical protein